MHYVDGREPRSRPRKRLYDVIHVNIKSLNLSNEDVNNEVVWNRTIKLKQWHDMHTSYMQASYHVDSGR